MRRTRSCLLYTSRCDEETVLKWLQAANKNKVNLKNARICSIHFTPSCYRPKPAHLANCENYSPNRLRTLNDHAIPTENLPPSTKIYEVKEKGVLKKERNQQNIISENSSFSEFETNLIDTSMEIKAEPYFMQSPQENASFISASDKTIVNTQSNSQTVKSEQLSFFSEFETNLMDTSVEIKIEPYFMQSPQENDSFTSASDETMINAQSNSQTVMSEELRYQEILNLKEKLKEANKEIDLLKKKVERLEREKITITKRVIKENVHNVLKKIFTPKQIDVLISNEKKVKWGPEDISAAITLRNMSREAYRFLKEKNYPLPALSTLSKWKRRSFISH
ncbi:Protein T [Temnothorax longispinosus]|uniref:Protein T n=1 Tax=Temnothorax longispinosus TaxID=300112 RepID=A0A4V3S9R3_9HYME|nr:Protein T [Temnothorax longispinosus]